MQNSSLKRNKDNKKTNNNYLIANKNDNRKARSFPFVTLNKAVSSNNRNNSKKANKKPSLFQNGWLNFFNFNVASNVAYDVADEDYVEDECLENNSVQEKKDINKVADISNISSPNVNNYLTIDYKLVSERRKSSLATNHSAKSLPLASSRISLANIDFTNKKLISCLTPSIAAKPYQKKRSKSEALLNIPKIPPNISNIYLNNGKRLSVTTQTLIKQRNSKYKLHSPYLYTPTKTQKFSLRTLFKVNNNEQQTSVQQKRSQSVSQQPLTTSNSKSYLNKLNCDENLDENYNSNCIISSADNTQVEKQSTDNSKYQAIGRSLSSYKNIFEILRSSTRKLSHTNRISSTSALNEEHDNEEIHTNLNPYIRRSSTLNQSIISKLKNRRIAKTEKLIEEDLKEVLTCCIDFQVKFDNDSNEITILMANTQTKPVIEINKIKSKLMYVCKNDKNLNNLTNNNQSSDDETSLATNSFVTKKILKKQNFKLIKTKKVNFDANKRSNVKKIKFSLFKEAINNTDMLHSFILDMEIQSYVPISRKILSSTFRNTKRKFKGQLVFENIELYCLNDINLIAKDFEIFEV